MRILSMLLLFVLACSAPPPARALVVLARDEDGRALPGLAVEIDGLPATRTDAEGSARISLSSEGPSRARISVACPEGSREANPRHVARQAEGMTARLELRFVCRPALRLLAIVVRAEGGVGSVLRADGEPVGTVAADGTLHAMVWRAPDSELQLMLDTGTLPVRPRNPVREHRVADRDELLVFDLPLHVALAKPARTTPARTTKVGLPKRAGRMAAVDGVFGGRR
ncbi:MAG: hypothetical protein ABW352_22140 [Polyangiales bacterium]